MKKFSFLTVQLELKLVMGIKGSVCFQMWDTNGMKLFVTINHYMLQEYNYTSLTFKITDMVNH